MNNNFWGRTEEKKPQSCMDWKQTYFSSRVFKYLFYVGKVCFVQHTHRKKNQENHGKKALNLQDVSPILRNMSCSFLRKRSCSFLHFILQKSPRMNFLFYLHSISPIKFLITVACGVLPPSSKGELNNFSFFM